MDNRFKPNKTHQLMAKFATHLTSEQWAEVFFRIFPEEAYNSLGMIMLRELFVCCPESVIDQSIPDLVGYNIEHFLSDRVTTVKLIRLYQALVSKHESLIGYPSSNFEIVLDYVGNRIVKEKSYSVVEMVMDDPGLSWAAAANAKTSRKIAEQILDNIFSDTNNWYVSFLAIIYTEKRFFKKIYEFWNRSQNQETLLGFVYILQKPQAHYGYKSDVWKKFQNISEKLIRLFFKRYPHSPFILDCKNTPADILEKSFNTLVHQDKLSYLDHPSCSSSLLKKIWNQTKKEEKHHPKFLLHKMVPQDVVHEICSINDAEFLKKYKKRIIQLVGLNTFDSYISAVKLSV